MYYNTTNQTGKTLTSNWDNSKTQEELIMDFFGRLKERYRGAFTYATPDQVCEAFDNRFPITSIRRAMSDLTMAGKLQKTTIQRKGRYGKMNYCWKLSEVN